VLQLKPAAWPEDISALNAIGVGGCHASERDPDSSEQHDHAIGHAALPAQSLFNGASMRCHRFRLLFQRFDTLTDAIHAVHVLILQGLG
jgi:hypothetical protein